MRIYTRTGDDGSTGIIGGKRQSKASARMHAYGTLDELNSLIGVIVTDMNIPSGLKEQLAIIQQTLFSIGSDLATPQTANVPVTRLEPKSAAALEHMIDEMEEALPRLTQFIIPGSSAAGARLHVARTVCRRAERWIVQLNENEPVNPAVLTYVNRLSDYLFVAARYVNKLSGAEEIKVEISKK